MNTLTIAEDLATMNYDEYRKLMTDLLEEGKTTGPNQSEAYINYTNMSNTRMKRLDKTAKLSDELKAVLAKQKKQRWIVLTEAWCGDASQILPFLNKMQDEAENVSLELILRDENLDIMDQFLTNGGRSIPKLIALDEENEVLFSWGPRPAKHQEVYNDLKSQELPYSDISVKIHTMYAKDKGVEIQKEFVDLLNAKD